MLPAWFRIAVGLEESASLIRAYEPQVVPGLLQTEGYVRAITAASFPAATQDFTERTVALRLARQQLLTRPGPPGYWVVLDETVLRRPIGGRNVMRAQLEHLIRPPGSPNVTIQVIPFAAGWHPALYGMYNIFRFAGEQMPDIVYSEALTGAYYLNKPEETARYTAGPGRHVRPGRLTRPDHHHPPRHHEGDLTWTHIRNGMPAADLGGRRAGPSRGATTAARAWKPRSSPTAGSHCASLPTRTALP